MLQRDIIHGGDDPIRGGEEDGGTHTIIIATIHSMILIDIIIIRKVMKIKLLMKGGKYRSRKIVFASIKTNCLVSICLFLKFRIC